MKKSLKIISIVVIVLAVIAIGVGVYFIIGSNNNGSNKTTNKVDKKDIPKDTIEYTIDTAITKYMLNSKTTLKKIKDVYNAEVYSSSLAFGSDSYIVMGLPDDMISSNKLTKYEKKHKEYLKAIQDAFKNRFTYKLVSKYDENGITEQVVSIKTIYYALYYYDLDQLVYLIGEDDNPAKEEVSSTEKEDVALYKNKVIAMGILNKHLDEYINDKNEETLTAITFKGIEFSDEKQFGVLLEAINGSHYDNFTFDSEDKITKRNEEVKKMLKEKNEIIKEITK